jgi:sortase A
MKFGPWLERFLLVIGVTLLAGYLGMQVDSRVHFHAHMRAFERQKSIGTLAMPLPRELASNPVPDFSLWSPKRVESYRPTFLTNSDPPEAILRIPRIGLEVPVLEGTDKLTLNRGVGWIEGTARPGGPGNIGIAGHRDSFFRGLKDVVRGDVLELETIGARTSYIVDDIKIVDSADTDILLPRGSPAVTLVTCYPFYFIGDAPKRYIVLASLEQIIPATTEQVQPSNSQAHNNNNQEKTK